MCVACGSNQYESGGDCVACRVTCGSGEYVSGSCGGASDYGCTACNNGAGVGTEYYTGPASTIGQSNCPVSACSACPPGLVIGTACSATSNTVCIACGGNMYESGGDCVPCLEVCGTGEYVSGSCGGASDYDCTVCDNGAGVGSEYYIGPSTTINVSDCPVSPCTVTCPVGEVIGNQCSLTRDTGCVACGSNLYESGGECVACRVTCASGEFVSGSCGGASDYGCSACTNGAGTQFYTGPATTIGVSNCPVSTCTTSGSCVTGQYLAGACGGSSGTSNPSCTACTNYKPVNSTYTSSGGNSNSCSWTCNPEHYYSSNACRPCRTSNSCGTGQYLSGTCGGGSGTSGSSNPSCTACTNYKPVNSTYTSSGGNSNSCSWSCNPEHYYSSNACRPCRTSNSCGTGQYLSGTCGGGSGTSGSSNPSCTACTNYKPVNSTYTSSGGNSNSCSWTCNPEHYYSSNACRPCRTSNSCGTGQYLSGTCGGGSGTSGTSNPSCTACTNSKPLNSAYSSSGGSSNSCGWTCNPEHYYHPMATICTACTSSSSCANGRYLYGTCGGSSGSSGTSNPSCVPCLNAKPDNSEYTGNGGTTGTCPWACHPGFRRTGAFCSCLSPDPMSGQCVLP